jgi:hypothetical protein
LKIVNFDQKKLFPRVLEKSSCHENEISGCQFNKHFTIVTYTSSKVTQFILKTLNGSMLEMNGTAYFAMAVNYGH